MYVQKYVDKERYIHEDRLRDGNRERYIKNGKTFNRTRSTNLNSNIDFTTNTEDGMYVCTMW